MAAQASGNSRKPYFKAASSDVWNSVTLPFWRRITIAAIRAEAMRVSDTARARVSAAWGRAHPERGYERFWKPGRRAALGPLQERGRRRTRQDQISLEGLKDGPVKLRSWRIRTERRKLVSSAGPVSRKSELLENTIQPFDLMSRRHPLSSIEAVGLKICL